MASKSNPSDQKDILKNELYFPSFRNLCDENELDSQYWKEDHRGVWVQACTWCFLGEITNDASSQITFERNRVLVRDRRGKDGIPIYFYPERGEFDFTTLKRGHTLCALLALQHHFLDGTIGLRIEALDTVKVIPCSLNDLFAMSTLYSQGDTCWACQKTATDDDTTAATAVNLKKCGACLTAKYCCKECQVKDWKQRHQKWCKKALPEFLKLTKIDYRTYNESALFGFFPYSRMW